MRLTTLILHKLFSPTNTKPLQTRGFLFAQNKSNQQLVYIESFRLVYVTIKRNHMETITPTKSQQKLIERVANALANGYNGIEHDLDLFVNLLEAKTAHVTLQDKLQSLTGLVSSAPSKRPYTRKPKAEPSLLEKSGVQAASESLSEQKPESVKRSSRKKETAEEIKGNIEELSIDL